MTFPRYLPEKNYDNILWLISHCRISIHVLINVYNLLILTDDGLKTEAANVLSVFSFFFSCYAPPVKLSLKALQYLLCDLQNPKASGKHHQLPYIHHNILAKHPTIPINSSLFQRRQQSNPPPRHRCWLEDVLEINQPLRQITICTSFCALPSPSAVSLHPQDISRQEDYRPTDQLMSETADGEGTNGVILWRQPIHVLPVTWRPSHS